MFIENKSAQFAQSTGVGVLYSRACTTVNYIYSTHFCKLSPYEIRSYIHVFTASSSENNTLLRFIFFQAVIEFLFNFLAVATLLHRLLLDNHRLISIIIERAARHFIIFLHGEDSIYWKNQNLLC